METIGRTLKLWNPEPWFGSRTLKRLVPLLLMTSILHYLKDPKP